MVFIIGGSLLYFTLMMIVYKKCVNGYRRRRNFVELVYDNDLRLDDFECELDDLRSEIRDFKKETNRKMRNRFKTLKRKISNIDRNAKRNCDFEEYGRNPFEGIDFNRLPSFELDANSFCFEPNTQNDDIKFNFDTSFPVDDLFVEGKNIEPENIE